jgi:hypothetical protein
MLAEPTLSPPTVEACSGLAELQQILLETTMGEINMPLATPANSSILLGNTHLRSVDLTVFVVETSGELPDSHGEYGVWCIKT